MIRTKNNFKPFQCPCGSGSSMNQDLIDGAIPMNSYSEKISLDLQNQMNELEQPTPFQVDQIPEGITEK